MTLNPGIHLSTSRINRLFRPLRSKCTALAEIAAASLRKQSAVSVTYSNTTRGLSRTSSLESDAPLAILQPPESLGLRIHLDKASVENLRLSRKIYEVRDAFRNVVQMAIGAGTATIPPEAKPIMGLAVMCAVIIGENIEADSEAYQELKDEYNDTEEDIAARVMEELYESIPQHYRSYSVVAHALSLILSICPHHPSLLKALLEVCLAHHLVPESHLVLFHLFCSSIQPSIYTNNLSSPLAHPAHSNYLTDLRNACCATVTGPGQRADSNRPSLRLDDFTFTRILCDALTSPSPQMSGSNRYIDAWTSRAVARLARELRTQDVSSFLHLCTGLGCSIVEMERLHVSTRTRKKGNEKSSITSASEPVCQRRLRTRLSRWLKTILDDLVQSGRSGPVSNDTYRALVEFLLQASLLGLYRQNQANTSEETTPAVSDTLMCLTTLILSTPVDIPTTDLDTLSSTLYNAQPRPETYDVLSSIISSPPVETPPLASAPSPSASQTPTPTPTSPSTLPPESHQIALLMSVLEPYAAALHARRLFLHEAALWSAALRYIEERLVKVVFLNVTRTGTLHYTPSQLDIAAHADMHELRMQLVQRVEAAEARHFTARGLGVHPPSMVGDGGPVTQARRRDRSGAPASQNTPAKQFVWEEMVGSWVERSPVVPVRRNDSDGAPKRRKLRHEPFREIDVADDTRQRLRSGTGGGRGRASVASSAPAVTSLKNSSGTRGRQFMPAPWPSSGRTRTCAGASKEMHIASDDFDAPPGSQSIGRRLSLSAANIANIPSDDDENMAPRSAYAIRGGAETSSRLQTQQPTRRRASLADAIMNCIVLHPKPRSREPQLKSALSRASSLTDSPTNNQSRRSASPSDNVLRDVNTNFSDGFCSAGQLSSDDVLDLFAHHGSSSPMAARH